MNVTALPSASPSPISTRRQRAIEIVAAWLAWRARRVKLEHAVEMMAFATLLLAWAVSYVVLCPMVAQQHHAAHRPAPVFVVLR